MRRLGEVLDEVVPEVCGELALCSMPEVVRWWVEVRGGCWIDRMHENSGRFAQVVDPAGRVGGKYTVSTRRACLEACHLPWFPHMKWASVCGSPSCVRPDHLEPLRSRTQHEAAVSRRVRIPFSSDESCRAICEMWEARGLRLQEGHSGNLRVGHYRVCPRAGRVESRPRSVAGGAS